jgi:GTP-binding protein
MIDLLPADGSDPIENAFTIINELDKYSDKLANKPRWIIFNKVDLLSEEDTQAKISEVLEALAWEGDYYCISALTRNGTKELTYDLMTTIESLPQNKYDEVEEKVEKVEFKWDDYHAEQIKKAEEDDDDDDDWDNWNEDDYDVEIIYKP